MTDREAAKWLEKIVSMFSTATEAYDLEMFKLESKHDLA
jgi:hypothetical protein